MASPVYSRQSGTITTPIKRPPLVPFPTASSSKSSISPSTSIFDSETPPSGGVASPSTPPDDIVTPSILKQIPADYYFGGSSENGASVIDWGEKSDRQCTPSPSPSGHRNAREPQKRIYSSKLKLEPFQSEYSDHEDTDLATHFISLKLSPEDLSNTHQSSDSQNHPPEHRIIDLASSEPSLADDGIALAVPTRSRKLRSSATLPRLFKSLKSELTHDEYLLIILDDCLWLRDYWGNEPGMNHHFGE
jgi:hypothetical protein